MDNVPARKRDCHVFQTLRTFVVISHADIQLLLSHIYITGRYGKIRGSHQLGHGADTEMILLQLLRNQFYAGILLLSAGNGHLAHGAEFLKFRHQLLIHICIEITVHGPAYGKGNHRLGVHIQLHDIGLLNVVRHVAADSVNGLLKVDVGRIHVSAVLILNQHHSHIFLGVGLDRVHSVQGRDGVLLFHRNQVVHVLRAGPCIHRGNNQHGHFHLRRKLQLGPQKRLYAKISNGNQAQHDGDGPAHRKLSNINHLLSPAHPVCRLPPCRRFAHYHPPCCPHPCSRHESPLPRPSAHCSSW